MKPIKVLLPSGLALKICTSQLSSNFLVYNLHKSAENKTTEISNAACLVVSVLQLSFIDPPQNCCEQWLNYLQTKDISKAKHPALFS